MSGRDALLKQFYSALDVNKLSDSFQYLVDSLGLDDETEAGEIFYGLYIMAYYIVRGKFEEFLAENSKLAQALDKILQFVEKETVDNKGAKDKQAKDVVKNLEIMKVIDKISLVAFKTTFLDKVEQELKKLIDDMAQQSDLMVKLGKYVATLNEVDPKKASEIAEYARDGRYAKILSIL